MLRARKDRRRSLFAVLVGDLVEARRVGQVDRAAEALLTDPATRSCSPPLLDADLADASPLGTGPSG